MLSCVIALLTWHVILNQALEIALIYGLVKGGKKYFYLFASSILRQVTAGSPRREIRRLDVGVAIFSCPYCG